MVSGKSEVLHLIIGGNKKINTFANTLRAVAKQWGANNFRQVHLVRFESVEELPDWRSLSAKFLPLAVYEETPLPDTKSYIVELSKLIHRLTIEQGVPKDAIFIDLTNATKTWSDVAYLVSTLTQIENIFRLKLSPEYFSLPYNEVNDNLLSLSIEPFISLQELRLIVRSTFSEYICYLNEVRDFVDWISNQSLLNINHVQLYNNLLRGLEYHIREEYDSCIIKVASVLEQFLDELLQILETKFSSHWMFLTNNQPKPKSNSLGSKSFTLGQVCTRINYIISGTVPPQMANLPEIKVLANLQETFQFAPLISIGFVLQSLGSIRNYSGHGNTHSPAMQTELDSQQVLNSMVYIFGKTRACMLLRK